MCASMFPAIIGSNFPGAIYLTQTLKFRKPVEVASFARLLNTARSDMLSRTQSSPTKLYVEATGVPSDMHPT